MNQNLKQYGTLLLLPYLILLFCLFIPGEIIITHAKVDETSIELVPYGFKTVLYGYQSKIIIIFLILTLFIQALSLFKKSFLIDFFLIFLTLIYLGLSCFLFFFHSKYTDFGFYFCFGSSASILFFNLKQWFRN